MQRGVFSNNRPVLNQLSFASSAGRSFADLASAVRLNDRQQVWNVARKVSTIDARNPQKLFVPPSHPSRALARSRRPAPLRSCTA
jgi:hypothetical protein